jgi:hypothetical protein
MVKIAITRAMVDAACASLVENGVFYDGDMPNEVTVAEAIKAAIDAGGMVAVIVDYRDVSETVEA